MGREVARRTTNARNEQGARLPSASHQELQSVPRTHDEGVPNQVTPSMDLGTIFDRHQDAEQCSMIMAVDNCDISTVGIVVSLDSRFE
jgi:hypothetical protein